MSWFPFAITPKGLLLEGKDKEKAKARYELKGEELDYKLLELEYDDKESKEYLTAQLELDRKYEKADELTYDKRKATLNDEPWVGYKDYGLEETDGRTGFWFEFDWNDQFIAKLKEEGYEAVDDENLVRKWYAELCRVVALDEGLAMDLFTDEEETVGSSTRKRLNDDGTADYS